MAGPRKVYVIGVGMTKFEKPGRRENFDYPDMALEAGTKALKDAGISYDKIEQACIGYVYGDSTCGQRALYQLGLTGIPMYNVNNNCSTGSTALMMAKQLVEGGLTECVMALGFEKMERGSLSAKFTDRTQPMDKHVLTMLDVEELTSGPMAAQMFGNAGRAHMQQYGTKPEHFAKIAHKNHKHSTNNPYSQFQDEYSLEQIQKSPMIHEPLTKLQCCPTSDGAGCAILASEDFVVRHRLQGQAVEIVAQTMATDLPSTFTEKNCMKIVGYDMTKKAATDAFRKAGITPQDVQVVELHDCFSANELISYEALGLCPEGKAGEFIDRGDNTYGGRVVVNPSGGLISKGHPLGATGLAQCSELCWQLRGLAGKRQVNNVRYALQHNIGLGGAVVVTIYKLGWPQLANKSLSAGVQMSATSAQRSDYKAAAIFDQIEEQLKQNGEDYVKKVKGIFCFKVKKGSDTGVFVVDVKNGKGSVKFDPNGKGDVTISATDDDLLNLLNGKLNPQQAFFQGKLKIAGNMGLAMKLKELQPNTKAKL
jgi:sterol carrier protein 2